MTPPFPPEALASLLDGQFAVEVTVPTIDDSALFKEELLLIENAVPKRRAEFSAGRAAARKALGRIGIEPAPLMANKDRTLCWPTGTIGSVSHTHGCVAVAVTTDTQYASVGIDIETSGKMPTSIKDLVCSPTELNQLRSLDLDAKLLFSAKEALFKCQFPVWGLRPDFLEVEIAIDIGNGTFKALTAPFDKMEGTFANTNNFLLTTALLAHQTNDQH